MSNLADKRILVTGGTGFIGLNVVQYLITAGVKDIYVTTNKLRPFFYDEHKWQHLVHLTQADLTNAEECDRVTTGIDYVVVSNAVSFGAKFIQNNPLALINANTIMNVNLLNAAANNGVQKVVYYGSTTGYPDTEHPVKEEDMFTGDPFEKYFSVGWMKRYAEILMRLYAEKLKKMTCVSLRLSNVYGPYDKFNPETSHVLPALIRKFALRQNPLEVWGDGTEARDLIHVHDVAEATLAALEKLEGFHAINIGAGKTHTVNDLIKILSKVEGYQPELKYIPNNSQMIKVRQVNTDKAKTLLDFEPYVDLEDGIAHTLDWFKQNHSIIYR